MFAYLALAGLQMYGSYQQGQITQENGELQNQIANFNSQFAELDAYNARQKGSSDAARYESQVDQTQAAGKAAEAGAGVDVGYGTAKDITAANSIAATQNTLQIQRAANNTAMGYENQAVNIRLGGATAVVQAGLTASSQEMSGLMNAASTTVAGYAYSQNTGKGQLSNTGSNTGFQWSKPVADMWAAPGGDSMTAPQTAPQTALASSSGWGTSFSQETA